MDTRKYICLIGLLLALLHPVLSSAQVTFYVTADGDKAFIIEGDDIEAKSAVELTVVYDSNALTNPRVRLAQGTVTDIVESAGTVIIKAVQGDDSTATFEAHLSFDKKGDSQGRIFSVTGKIMEPGGAFSSTRTLPGASTPFVLQSFSGDEEMPAEGNGISGDRTEILSLEQSVLQRFRDFKGKRGLKAFAALFDRCPDERIIQEPPIVLSDGKTPVRITLPSKSLEGDLTNIALSDAKLVQVGREDGKGWVVTALPNAGAWDTRLIVKMDEKIFEFPLVVAPPVKIQKGMNERNFLSELDRFLSDRLGAGKGGNNPHRHILFEYFFTANYLASLENATVKMTAELKSPVSESN